MRACFAFAGRQVHIDVAEENRGMQAVENRDTLIRHNFLDFIEYSRIICTY